MFLNIRMKGILLDRVVIGEANSPEFGARATTHEGIRRLRAKKTIVGRIAPKGLLVATICVLLTPTHGLSQADATPINLLSPSNGGQVVVASSDAWLKTIDGDESRGALYGAMVRRDDWAVYAFKDRRTATFDTFALQIPETSPYSVKQFELLAGDSPAGEFTSSGKFTTVNAKVFPLGYQEFKFPPVTAKYLKVHLLSNWGAEASRIELFQFRLIGQLKE
jgi:hypothetical protein